MRSFRNRAVLLLALCFVLWLPALLFGQVRRHRGHIRARHRRLQRCGTRGNSNAQEYSLLGQIKPSAPMSKADTLWRTCPSGPTNSQRPSRFSELQLAAGLTLTVGSTPVIDFQLTVGQATETVSVSAEVAQVADHHLRRVVARESNPDARTAAQRPRLRAADSARARCGNVIRRAEAARSLRWPMPTPSPVRVRKAMPTRWMAKMF